MLEIDNENDEPLLSEKFDNIINNFEEINLNELNTDKSNLNRKGFVNNILEKDEIKIENNRKHNHSKSSEQKRKISKKKEEKRKNIELLGMKDNKNDKIDYFNFEVKKVGFPNLGHTCYMNSFLQILIHTPNFIKELKILRGKNKINNELVNCLINLTKEQYNNLSKIKEIMGIIDKSYSEFCQKDSQKFGIDLLNYLIQIIKDENEDEIQNSEEKYNNSFEFISNYENLGVIKQEKFKNYKDENFPKRNEISLERMFLFHESKIKIEINSNEIKNIRFEAYLNININLTNKTNQTNNLIDLLNNIYNNQIKKNKIINDIQNKTIIIPKEKIENESNQQENDTQNHITFGQKICNCFSSIIKFFKDFFSKNDQNDTVETNSETSIKKPKYFIQRKLANLPNILIISINRAILGEPFNKSFIYFEKILDIKQFLDDDLLNIESQNTEYKLYAINECKSNNGESGHYYSFINTSDDEWFEFNDEYTRRVEPSFNSEHVAGLFYVKKDYFEENFFNK